MIKLAKALPNGFAFIVLGVARDISDSPLRGEIQIAASNDKGRGLSSTPFASALRLLRTK
jgi:hypothetical protein